MLKVFVVVLAAVLLAPAVSAFDSDFDLSDVEFDEDDDEFLMDLDEVEIEDEEEEQNVGSTGSASATPPVDEFDAYDDDEFVGVEQLRKSKNKVQGGGTKKTRAKLASLKSGTAPRLPSESDEPLSLARKYTWEIVAGGCLVLYLIVFIWGSRRNRAIAEQWMARHGALLYQHFSRVEGLRQESYNEYSIYVTGRVNCRYMRITLTLLKRQGLFLYIYDLLSSAKDSVFVDIVRDSSEPFVFAVLQRKRAVQLRKDVADLAKFTSQLKPSVCPTLDESFAILTDAGEEIVPWLLTPEVVSTLNKRTKSLIALHLTDQSPYNPTSKVMLHLAYKMGEVEDIDKPDVFIKMGLFLIDKAKETSLSRGTLAKVQQLRIAAEEENTKQTHAERQEAAQARRTEKLRRKEEERAAAYAKLTPEQKKKWDAKEEARKKKIQMGGRTKAMMVRS